MDPNLPPFTPADRWAPPHPGTRYLISSVPVSGPPPAPRRPRSARTGRVALAAAAVFVGSLLGVSGALAIRNASSSHTAAPVVTVQPTTTSPAVVPLPSTPPTTPRTTAPAVTTPRTTTPATAAPPATTAPVVTDPSATPTTKAPAQTTKRSSLDTGVVDIVSVLAYQSAETAGTGMVLTANGEILTNNHVIDGATRITVTVVSTGASYSATVVGTDPSHDVAVLQLKGASGLATIKLGDSSTVKVGDPVTAVGNAGGRGGEPTVAPGQVTALDQTITASDEAGGKAETLDHLIQVDANLQPGESGGPLYNAAGQVVGIDTAGSASNTRFRLPQGSGAAEGYAIPINDALAVAKQVEAGDTSGGSITLGTPAFMGITAHDASTDGSAGVAVDNVVSGSPAEATGLQPGDRIVSIGGTAVASTDELTTVLHAHKAGDVVAISWVTADGASHSGKVTLAAGPAN